MPMWVYFVGKLAMNLIFTVAIVAGMALLAQLAGDADFDAGRLLATAGVLLLGTIVFSPMGRRRRLPRPAQGGDHRGQPGVLAAVVPVRFLLSRCASCLRCCRTSRRGCRPTTSVSWPGGRWHPRVTSTLFGAERHGGTTTHLIVIAAWFALCTLATVWGYRRESNRERS